jgi:predicted DNA-binding transcriptional regulator AlpA
MQADNLYICVNRCSSWTMENANTTPLVTDEYMESGELSKELGICWRTLHRFHLNREGPPRVKIGRKVLYRRESVREWLRSREEAQPRSRKRSA